MLQSDGSFEKVKTAVTDMFPKSYGSWWYSQVEMNDFKLAFNGHHLQMLVEGDNLVVPKFEGLPEKYRYFKLNICLK